MWANAQRDGRPAEYRWRPLFNAVNFGWRPLLECRVVTMPRRETRWNLQGCPKLPNRSQAVVGRSSTYCEDMEGIEILLFNKFFPIVDICLSCEGMARQRCAMVSRWWLLASFWVLRFQRAARSTFQTCILNTHYGHTMCRSMVDIQSAAAEIRRGKRWKKDTTGQKYDVRIWYAGRP